MYSSSYCSVRYIQRCYCLYCLLVAKLQVIIAVLTPSPLPFPKKNLAPLVIELEYNKTLDSNVTMVLIKTVYSTLSRC
jgi:hypothetical protein